MALQANILPKLPFGENKAELNCDINVFSTHMSKMVPGLQYFDTVDQTSFVGKTKIININNFKIASMSCSPTAVKATSFKEINIIFQYHGSSTTVMDGKSYGWFANQSAILMPNIERTTLSTDYRAGIVFDLNEQRLYSIAKVMLGLDQQAEVNLRLQQPRLLPLYYGETSFNSSIRKLCDLIEIYNCDEEILKKLGIDEFFYRNIVTMLLPDAFFMCDKNEYKRTSAQNTLKQIIEYENNNPNIFTNLTELEKFAGLSSRSLQYVFKETLSITPTQWLRKQKLQYAKNLILNSGMNVTNAAINAGFTNFSFFSKYYKFEFGELPSETLLRSKNR